MIELASLSCVKMKLFLTNPRVACSYKIHIQTLYIYIYYYIFIVVISKNAFLNKVSIQNGNKISEFITHNCKYPET